MQKAFGLERIVEKGFCPFLLNDKEEINYVGRLPDEWYFGTDIMKSNDLARFQTWYNLNQGIIFDLKFYMVKYCANDVLILLLSVMKFRNQFKEITSIDPITRNFTLASIGLEIFRAKFLKPEQLAITPISGYSSRRSSIISNIWLSYREVQANITINREYRIGNYYADGFHVDSSTVYEFLGVCIMVVRDVFHYIEIIQ